MESFLCVLDFLFKDKRKIWEKVLFAKIHFKQSARRVLFYHAGFVI